MEVIALIGFSFGALGFLFSTISKLAEGRDKYQTCMAALRRYHLGLLEANAEMEVWNNEWPTNDDGYESYRGLWGGSYDAIVQVIEDIRIASARIQRIITKAAGISHHDVTLEQWRQKLCYLLGANLLRLVMVLYRHDSLGRYIKELKDSTNAVSRLTQLERRRRLLGHPIPCSNGTLRRLEKFVTMLRPVAELYERRGTTGVADEWALLLYPQEDGRNIREWEITHRVTTHFTFSMQAPELEAEMYMRVFCSLSNTNVQNIDWQRIISGQANASTVAASEPNPPTRTTRSLRELFMEEFLGDPITRKAWEPDRGRLLLALSNWTFLLWHTEWTTDLCCSGLRFVRPVTGEDAASTPTFILGQHVECAHHGWKLVNFGLVLAEVILAVPLRIDPDMEGKLEHVLARQRGQWTRLDLADVLGQVKDKTKSESVYMAIQFCLDQSTRLSHGPFEPYFLLIYLEKVFKP